MKSFIIVLFFLSSDLSSWYCSIFACLIQEAEIMWTRNRCFQEIFMWCCCLPMYHYLRNGYTGGTEALLVWQGSRCRMLETHTLLHGTYLFISSPYLLDTWWLLLRSSALDHDEEVLLIVDLLPFYSIVPRSIIRSAFPVQ